jgi:hypothetical protein
MARAILLFLAKRLGLARVLKFETRPATNVYDAARSRTRVMQATSTRNILKPGKKREYKTVQKKLDGKINQTRLYLTKRLRDVKINTYFRSSIVNNNYFETSCD